MAGLQCLQVLYSKTRASSLGADLLVWSLLSDDDEEVRIGATSIIHDELALKTPMCRDRAAEMFWQRLLRTYHASKEWNNWLWSKVIDQPMIGEHPILMPTMSSPSDGPPCEEKHLEEVSKSNLVLFATEAPNLYHQEYDDVARAAEALVRSTSSDVRRRENSYWLHKINVALSEHPRISSIDSRGDSLRILHLIAEQLERLSKL